MFYLATFGICSVWQSKDFLLFGRVWDIINLSKCVLQLFDIVVIIFKFVRVWIIFCLEV